MSKMFLPVLWVIAVVNELAVDALKLHDSSSPQIAALFVMIVSGLLLMQFLYGVDENA